MNDPAAAEPASRSSPSSPHVPVLLALLATLALWLAHASLYRFLTDDAFISFRYARNLSHGFGLVFNPGLERVEGYTNFLFVLVLAALDRLGLPPERAANGVLLLATLALWAVLARWAWRRAPERSGRWLALLPLALLGLARPIAVWSSSGLETRLFETLVVAAVLRLIGEASRAQRGEAPGAPLAGVAFGLAALTRPEGVLIGACAFGAAALHAVVRRRSLVAVFGRSAPFLLLVLSHLVFRLACYGEIVPNTYFVKVGGRLLWGSGFEYLGAFALEYFAWAWVPLVIAGVWRCVRRGEALVPLIWAAAILPYLVYVVAIGGDHFEYRPLGLALIAAVLGIHEAFLAASERAVPRWAIALAAIAIGAGLVWIPWQTHTQFPASYQSGYPGLSGDRSFLSASRTPGGSLPVLGSLLGACRERLVSMTRRYVGLRQEEHRLFESEVEGEASRLRALIDRGAIRPDARVAMGSVGVIPYVTNLPTLDVLGLTDRRVARMPFDSGMLAHGKHATIAYARQRGVELWFEGGVRLLRSSGSLGMLRTALAPDSQLAGLWVADAGDGLQALARLPNGPAGANRAAPGLRFGELTNPLVRRELLERLIAWHEQALFHDRENSEIARRLAALRQRLARDLEEAKR